ncbi:hypothetical protein OPAG_05951 [Rhodococcus opacus PD630]|nr:hypothetical protein OPAG_05951 [Rhodococcus opacus PD630]
MLLPEPGRKGRLAAISAGVCHRGDMATYRYLDKDRNVLEEQDFGTVQDAEEHRLSVLGAEIIEEVEDSGTPES